MPYKPELMTALNDDFGDAARKYMETRNRSAEEAERYLCRMKLIGRNMEATQKMIDKTIGKTPLHYADMHHAAPVSAPVASSRT